MPIGIKMIAGITIMAHGQLKKIPLVPKMESEPVLAKTVPMS